MTNLYFSLFTHTLSVEPNEWLNVLMSQSGDDNFVFDYNVMYPLCLLLVWWVLTLTRCDELSLTLITAVRSHP